PIGVPPATGAGASGCGVASTLAVGVAVGSTATFATFRTPAPESARGTVPSTRNRIATIPMPQRAWSPRSRASNASKRRKPGLRSRRVLSGSGDCRKALVHHGVVTTASELANDRGDRSGSAVNDDGVLPAGGELRGRPWVDAHSGARREVDGLREGERAAGEVVPADRHSGRGDALQKDRR